MLTQPFEKEPARRDQAENIRTQLSKLGNTPFEAVEVTVAMSDNWFVPSSLLAEMRRQGVERLISTRRIRYRREEARPVKPCVGETLEIPFPEKRLTYLGNVSNSKAGAFYKAHGVTAVEDAFELSPQKDVPLMFTKHCLRYSMDGALLTRSRSLPIRSLTCCAIRKRSCVCASTARIARC